MIPKLFLDIPAYIALIPVIYSITKASYLDYKYRTIPLKTWYPALVGVFIALITFTLKIQTGWINMHWAILMLMSAAILIILSLGFSYFGAFGGADAIGIGLMTLSGFYICINDFFVISFVKNICVCCGIMILCFFILNLKDGCLFDKNKKISYMFLARRMFPSEFNKSFGVVLQKPDGTITNSHRVLNYESSLYYAKTIDATKYNDGKKYWVLHSIPFVIPISIAFIITIIVGDLLVYI